MENFADELYQTWNPEDAAPRRAQFQSDYEAVVIESASVADELAQVSIVSIPANMAAEALRYRAAMEKYYPDRARVDRMVAGNLADRGATTDQIFSFMRHHAAWDGQRISQQHAGGRPYQQVKHPTQSSRDLYATQTALNATAVSVMRRNKNPQQADGEMSRLAYASLSSISDWERRQAALDKTPAMLAHQDLSRMSALKDKSIAAESLQAEARQNAKAREQHTHSMNM
jgi:hypothetical protein